MGGSFCWEAFRSCSRSAFKAFLWLAERPQLGLAYSIAAGVTNMVLDYVLIAVFHLGIAGAAIATVLGYVVGGIIPLFYFATGSVPACG